MDTTRLDDIRAAALKKFDRTERHYRIAFVGAAAIELLFLVTFVLLADLTNRVHVLLLISTVATYSIVAMGLIALGVHVNRNTLRILKFLEAMRDR